MIYIHLITKVSMHTIFSYNESNSSTKNETNFSLDVISGLKLSCIIIIKYYFFCKVICSFSYQTKKVCTEKVKRIWAIKKAKFSYLYILSNILIDLKVFSIISPNWTLNNYTTYLWRYEEKKFYDLMDLIRKIESKNKLQITIIMSKILVVMQKLSNISKMKAILKTRQKLNDYNSQI